MKYKKSTPRLEVKFVDAETEDILFEINDKNWMNVGNLLADHTATEIVKQNIKGDMPEKLMIIVVGEYTLSN